jgi:hypothetical protein
VAPAEATIKIGSVAIPATLPKYLPADREAKKLDVAFSAEGRLT